MAIALTLALGPFVAPAAAQSAIGPGSPAMELPPLDQLKAMRERPLFTPTRRPPEVKVEVAAPAPVVEDKSLPFELTGIVAGPDVRFAILRQKGQPEELRLRARQKVGNWTLEEIADRYVILNGNGKRVRVWLFDETKKAGITVNDVNAAAPPPAPAKSEDVDLDVVPNDQSSSRPVPPRPPLRNVQRPPGGKSPFAPSPRPN